MNTRFHTSAIRLLAKAHAASSSVVVRIVGLWNRKREKSPWLRLNGGGRAERGAFASDAPQPFDTPLMNEIKGCVSMSKRFLKPAFGGEA